MKESKSSSIRLFIVFILFLWIIFSLTFAVVFVTVGIKEHRQRPVMIGILILSTSIGVGNCITKITDKILPLKETPKEGPLERNPKLRRLRDKLAARSTIILEKTEQLTENTLAKLPYTLLIMIIAILIGIGIKTLNIIMIIGGLLTFLVTAKKAACVPFTMDKAHTFETDTPKEQSDDEFMEEIAGEERSQSQKLGPDDPPHAFDRKLGYTLEGRPTVNDKE